MQVAINATVRGRRRKPGAAQRSVTSRKFLRNCLSRSFSRRRTASAAEDRVAEPRIVGLAQVRLELLACPRDMVLVVDPDVPSLGPLVDPSLDVEGEEMVGEDLGVQALGQCSDLSQRSIPHEVERERAAGPIKPARAPVRPCRDRPQPTTRGPAWNPLARFPGR